MRRGAWEQLLRESNAPEIQATTVQVTGPTPTTVQILPNSARVYGVYLHGVGSGSPRVAVAHPGGTLLEAKVPATGSGAGWSAARAWVRTAGPVTATKLSGTAGQTVSCIVLWSPL